MRSAVLALAIVGGGVLVAWGIAPQAEHAWAQPAGARTNEPGLVAFLAEGVEGHRLLTIVDPVLRSVAVYQIDLASAQVGLKSVRNIDADLRLLEYNGQSPHPQEVRSMMDRGARRIDSPPARE